MRVHHVHVHVHHVYIHHELERLRGLGGEENDGTEECYHGDGRTIKQVNIVLLSLCETEFRNLSDIVFSQDPFPPNVVNLVDFVDTNILFHSTAQYTCFQSRY